MLQESKQIAEVLLNTDVKPMKHLSPRQENDFFTTFFKENSHRLQWGEDLAEVKVCSNDHQLTSVRSCSLANIFKTGYQFPVLNFLGIWFESSRHLH